MEPQQKKTDTNLAVLIHVSTFSKYLFPFGNFIFPVVLWAFAGKDRFVDKHAKQALNFQISLFLYYILLAGVGIAGFLLMAFQMKVDINLNQDNFHFSDAEQAIPFLIIAGIVGILLLALIILEIICVITASIKASEGQDYRYPLAIPFLNSSNRSINEQSDKNNNTKNETL